MPLRYLTNTPTGRPDSDTLPLVILLSSVVGAAIGITLMVFKGRDHNIPLAFGPYLAVAGGIALFFGPALIKGWYL